MLNTFYSPENASKLCNTSRNTIKRWIKAGKLKAHKTPGGHYKIVREDLISMMKEYDIPIPDESEIVSKRILIVDDDPQVRESTARYLRECGRHYEILTAVDGFGAGISVTQFRPDVMILDLMMPNLDGFNVCRKIRSNFQTKDIFIIVITGFGTEENIQRALESGADIVLNKPFDEEELLKGVASLVR